eukprot:m.295333 g.295333  ORF g.295333 m.295333 type:complete len:66 (+) comp16259_c1_seq36:4324-4521(+)
MEPASTRVLSAVSHYGNRVLPLIIVLTVIAVAWFVIYYVVLVRFKFFRELMGIEEKPKRKSKKSI